MKRIVSLVLTLAMALSLLTGFAGATQAELSTTSGGLTNLRMPGSMSFDFKLNGDVVDADRITDIQLDSKLGVIKQVESQWGQFQIDVGSAYPEQEGTLSLKIDGKEYTMPVSTAKADFGFYTSNDFTSDSYLVPDGMQEVFFDSGSEQKIWFQFTRDNKIASVNSSNALMSGDFNDAQVACFTVDPAFKGSFETELTVTDEAGENFRIFLSVSNVKVTTIQGGPINRETQLTGRTITNGISAPFRIDGYDYDFYMGVSSPGSSGSGNSAMELPMDPEAVETITRQILFLKHIGDGNYERVSDEEEAAILSAFGGTLTMSLAGLNKEVFPDADEPAYYPTLHVMDDDVCTTTAEMTVATYGVWLYYAAGTLYAGTEKKTSVDVTVCLNWRPRATTKYFDPESTEPDEILAEINAFLQIYVQDEDVQQIVRIPAGDYTGQIIVGEQGWGLEIRGDGEVTLHGGVINNSGDRCNIANIHFVGAGRNEKKWKEGSLAGEPNIAISGQGGGIVIDCTFVGYDHAVYAGMIMGVNNCVFMDNNVAVMENNEDRGGNPYLANNLFRNNNVALDFEHINENLPTTFFEIRGNRFVDNKWDVRNKLKRTLYLPGNFFGETVGEDVVARPCNAQVKKGSVVAKLMDDTTDEDNLEYAEQVHAYPRYTDTSLSTYAVESEAVVSVAQTAEFQIPQDNLSGTSITVMDAEDELATLVFPDSGVALQSEGGSFDATVSVKENEDGSLTFTMNDPLGLKPIVKVPYEGCGDAEVTHDGQLVECFVEDGCVCFEAELGGSYTILPSVRAERVDAHTVSVRAGLRTVSRAVTAVYDKDGKLLAVSIKEENLSQPWTVSVENQDLTQCSIKVMLLDDDHAPLCGAAFIKAK